MRSRRTKIAYVSGTRADFGLITPVLRAVARSEKLSLRVYTTGMHLMPLFGETVREVKKNFPDVARLGVTIESDDRTGLAKFAGTLLLQVVAAFTKDRPDFVLLLGDRAEMLVTATACLYLGIPTGHLHGGEKSATVDEPARHAISMLASLHFVATKNSAARLKKMGEDDWRIQVVGAPALDTIMREELPQREVVERFLKIGRGEQFILIVQHPVSGEWREAGRQMRETIAAVKRFGLPFVVVYPNADPGARAMIAEIEKEQLNNLCRIFPNIPYKIFLALEREAAVWVGNSSAALIESASFKTPVVNVGSRQAGRERGANIIDAGCRRGEITAALRKSLHDARYRARVRRATNPYGDGRASERVVSVLKHLPPRERLLAKQLTY